VSSKTSQLLPSNDGLQPAANKLSSTPAERPRQFT
jgi:hypothetical protein